MSWPTPALEPVDWRDARRIIRSVYPPIDLFEDIADPADWPHLIAAEQKSNPRLMETIGNIDLVPPSRRIAGPGASYLMAPFTHISVDRPSRCSDGTYGVLYVGREFETALAETIHHHARFMAATGEPPGWTSQFRELILDVRLDAHDVRDRGTYASFHDPVDYADSQKLSAALRAAGSDGILYESVRNPGGECVAAFFPDVATPPTQGRHLDYHWDGRRVDHYRDAGSREVFKVI